MGALQVTVDSVDSIIDACSIDFSVFSVHSCEEKDVYLSLATALGRWNRQRERENTQSSDCLQFDCSFLRGLYKSKAAGADFRNLETRKDKCRFSERSERAFLSRALVKDDDSHRHVSSECHHRI